MNVRKIIFFWKACFILITIGSVLFISNHFAKATEINQELSSTVQKFLPEDSQLVKPKQPANAEAIQPYDFDKDGIDEIVVTFKTRKEMSQPKVMMLKKVDGQWEKVWEKTGKGSGLNFSGLHDITGNGTKELVAGWMGEASKGNYLEIYQWKGQSLKQIANNSNYHKIDILKHESGTSLAIWKQFCSHDAYTVDVVSWDGNQLTHNENIYSQYYPNIKAFYDKKIKAMNAWYYQYALADAQIKANRLDEAPLTIQSGLSLTSEGKKNFRELQKRIAEKLNQR